MADLPDDLAIVIEPRARDVGDMVVQRVRPSANRRERRFPAVPD